MLLAIPTLFILFVIIAPMPKRNHQNDPEACDWCTAVIILKVSRFMLQYARASILSEVPIARYMYLPAHWFEVPDMRLQSPDETDGILEQCAFACADKPPPQPGTVEYYAMIDQKYL